MVWMERRTLMFSLGKSKITDSSGTNLIEFAALLPFLLLVLLGALEMGRVFFIRIALTNAAQAGVQYGAQSTGTAEDHAAIASAAEADFNGAFGLTLGFKQPDEPQTPCYYYACWDGTTESNQTACVQSPIALDCGSNRLVQFVRVDTTVQFESLFHYPGFPPSFTMNGHAVMRVP